MSTQQAQQPGPNGQKLQAIVDEMVEKDGLVSIGVFCAAPEDYPAGSAQRAAVEAATPESLAAEMIDMLTAPTKPMPIGGMVL